MEIKVNREIRDHSESLILGLSLRQLIFSALAILVAIGVYFLLRDTFTLETLSWLCILCAAPFAALGFVSYHGMTAEQFLWAWLRSEVIEPKRLYCKPTNLYYEALKDNIAAHEKEQVNPAKQKKPKYTGQYTKKAVRRRKKEDDRHA